MTPFLASAVYLYISSINLFMPVASWGACERILDSIIFETTKHYAFCIDTVDGRAKSNVKSK